MSRNSRLKYFRISRDTNKLAFHVKKNNVCKWFLIIYVVARIGTTQATLQ